VSAPRVIARRVIALLVAAAVLAVGVVVALAATSSSNKTLVAYFPRITGIYAGSSVRILGVPVGTVTKITVQGTRVRVDISYNSKYRLPADVDAVIVPPSIVSDRYIDLDPVYSGGPVLADHATIPQSRTEVPIELDQIFAEINQLNVALGPDGANRNGALSHLINISALNLAGNGKQFNTAITQFANLISTLSANRGNFFATLANLEKFSATLAADDGGVRQVAGYLAAVSGQLDAERQDLGLALRNLAIALNQVATFVRDNRSELTADIGGLTRVTGALLTQKRALEEFLDEAPTALVDLALTYDPATQTLYTRNNSNEYGSAPPTSPLSPFCQLAQSLGAATGQKISCSNLPSGASAPSSAGPGGLARLLGVAP
jgi:phospholipid/cholesterol/gamma-HCH transport system substrate-binding protein